MKKLRVKNLISMVLVLSLLLSVSLLAGAAEWWLEEATYTLLDTAPDELTGPESRIFLPKMSAVSESGIDLDILYEVKKDGQSVTSGEYAEGAYFDLNGAGTYELIYTGVDATNSYTFTIIADDEYPSLILDKIVPKSASISEIFSAPSAVIGYKSTKVDAQVRLEMASGAVYLAEEKAIPEDGIMTLQYTAEIDGKTFCFEYEIEVLNTEIGFYDENGTLYPAGTKPFDTLDLSGSVLNGVTTKKYTFSQILDLSQATKEDPLIVMNNAVVDQNTFALPHVYIVDAHDPQNYIEIVARICSDHYTVVYTVASTPGQAFVGHLGGHALYTATVFGTETTFASAAYADKSCPATYYYDAAEKAVYANWYGDIRLIADFDADYQTKPWKGFTTGEVYLVVERKSETDFFCIQSVAGHSLESHGRDTVAPKISLDMKGNTTVPDAVVGVQYPVFEATAVDFLESKVAVDVRVFKGYDAEDGVEMNVRDGSFIPHSSGYYTIVYTASDRYGNEDVKKVNVRAVNKDEMEAIRADISGIPSTAFVGERIELQTPSNVSGGIGAVDYQVFMIAPDGTETKVTEDYAVVPAAGECILRYTFTDYLGIPQNFDFKINASVSDDPILYNLTMPESLCSGTIFKIPAAEYADDASVKVEVTATLNGKKLDVTDNVVVPVVESACEELILTYKAVSATGSTTKSYSITVYGGDVADRSTFFFTTNGSFEHTQRTHSLGFTTYEAGSGVRFINSVLASKLHLSLSVDAAQNDSDRITVMLSDYMDASVRIRLDIVKKPGGDDKSKSEFYINGLQVNDIVGNFYGGVAALSISYNENLSVLTDGEGNTLGTLRYTEAGEPFTGFPSGKVNVEISVGDVGSKGFTFDVLQLNNQSFATDDLFFDNYPEIVVEGTVDLSANLGDTIALPSAKVSDVMSASTSVSLTIRKGMEPIVKDLEIDEPYAFTLDDYGTYYFVYSYSDGQNARSVTYAVQTLEFNAPEATVDGELPEKVKQNEKVKVPMAAGTDDYSEAVSVSVFVMDPDSCLTKLNEEDMQFTATKAGTYTVIYYVYDECFNYQVIKHEITVEGTEKAQ